MLSICLIIAFVCNYTFAYNDINDTDTVSYVKVFQYSKFKLDTALLLLETKKKFINFASLGSTDAFEYFLAEADIHFRKKNYNALTEVLDSADQYNEANDDENLKNRYNFYQYVIEESKKTGSRREELIDLASRVEPSSEPLLWIDIQTLIADIYQNEGNPQKARKVINLCIDKTDTENLLFEKGILVQLLALYQSGEGNYIEADSIFEEAIKIFEEINYPQGIAAVLSNKGTIYGTKGYYKKAIQNFHRSIPILEKANDDIALAYVNNNIGIVYQEQKDFPAALEYFRTSLDKFIEIDDLKLVSYVYVNIGVTYFRLEEYAKAEEFILKGIEIKKEVNDNRSLIYAYNKLGLLYLETGRYDDANSLLEKAYKLGKKIDFAECESETLLGFSMVNFDRNRLQDSEKYALTSLDISTKHDDLNLQLSATQHLSKIYEKNKNYYKSYTYLQKSTALKDSIYNIEKFNEIESLKFEYESNKKNLEQKLILQQSEAANLQKDAVISSKRRQLFLSVFLLLLSLITLGLLYKNSIEKKKSYSELSRVNNLLTENNDNLKHKQEVLEDMNHNLINFAGTAAHDLKSPLRTISSLSSLIAHKYEKVIQPNDLNILDLIKRNIFSLSKMIEDLLVFSKIDQDLPLPSKIDLESIIDSVKLLLKSQIEAKNGTIILHDSASVMGHKALLVVLFQNIIQNAIKFSAKDRDPIIEIKFKAIDKNQVEATITDNGIGINESQLDNIFKGFQKGHTQNEYEGTGIGLATCKKIVQHYKGEIKVESEIGIGTTFRFSLPT